MSLKTQMATDIVIFFNTNEFAVTVTYNGASIAAIWEQGENLRDTQKSGMKTGRLWVKTANVATPAYRDAVIINSVTWRVMRVIQSTDNVHLLELETSERPKL